MRPEAAGPSVRTFRLMMLACVGLVLAGAISVVAYDDEVTLDQTAAAGATTTTLPFGAPATVAGTESDPAADSVAGEGDDTSTAAAPDAVPTEDAASATTVASAPDPTPTTAQATPPATHGGTKPAAAPSPIAAGTYQYTTVGTMTIGTSRRDLPPVTSLTAEAADRDGRQVQIRDMRDDKGDGSITRTTFRYTPEGVYLEKLVIEIKIGGIGQTTTLTSAKPFLLLPSGSGAGTKTTGTLTGDGITAAITFTIASVDADKAVSDLVADLSGDVEGRQTSRITSRTSDLLTVDEKVDSDVRSGGIQVKTNYTATLR